jgi:putative spermidine/putrescine transport system permease protein
MTATPTARTPSRPRARRPGVLSLAVAGAVVVLVYVNAPLILSVVASFGSRGYLEVPPAGWSLRWYTRLLSDPSWLAAIGSSALVALGTALVSVVLGTMAGLGLARMNRRVSEGLLAVILTPLIIPHVVLAIGLFPVLGRLHLLDTQVAVIVGHTSVAVPLTVIMVLAAHQNVDPDVERAARSLGAGPWQVFREITLPLITPGVIGGGLLAFTVSFDELELALFLSGPSARTLPLKLWEEVQYELTPVVAAASTVIMLAVLAVLAGTALARRRAAAGWGRGVAPADAEAEEVPS